MLTGCLVRRVEDRVVQGRRHVHHCREPYSTGAGQSRGARFRVRPGLEFLERVFAPAWEQVYDVEMSVGAVLDAEADIEVRLRAVCGHLNVLHAQLVELAAEALATGSWQGWGVESLSTG